MVKNLKKERRRGKEEGGKTPKNYEGAFSPPWLFRECRHAVEVSSGVRKAQYIFARNATMKMMRAVRKLGQKQACCHFPERFWNPASRLFSSPVGRMKHSAIVTAMPGMAKTMMMPNKRRRDGIISSPGRDVTFMRQVIFS